MHLKIPMEHFGFEVELIMPHTKNAKSPMALPKRHHFTKLNVHNCSKTDKKDRKFTYSQSSSHT